MYGNPSTQNDNVKTANLEGLQQALREKVPTLPRTTTGGPRSAILLDTSVSGGRRGPFVKRLHWLITPINFDELQGSIAALRARIPWTEGFWFYVRDGATPVMGGPAGPTYPLPLEELTPNAIAELVAAVRSL